MYNAYARKTKPLPNPGFPCRGRVEAVVATVDRTYRNDNVTMSSLYCAGRPGERKTTTQDIRCSEKEQVVCNSRFKNPIICTCKLPYRRKNFHRGLQTTWASEREGQQTAKETRGSCGLSVLLHVAQCSGTVGDEGT
jgi:hypothetical protein